MLEWIKNTKHLKQVQQKHNILLILGFYANFSSASKRALAELAKFSKENKHVPVYIIDVGRIKGLHKQFGVESLPTVLALRKGEVTQRVEGVENARFYARIFLGVRSPRYKKDESTVQHHVTVYTGPGCPACGSAKDYLRSKGISFREVDIGREQHVAEKLFQRSGQMAVPQIEIDGHLIVGADQEKIDKFLSTQTEG